MKAIDPVRYEMFFYRLWAMAKKVGDELRRSMTCRNSRAASAANTTNGPWLDKLGVDRARSGESIPRYRLGEPGAASFGRCRQLHHHTTTSKAIWVQQENEADRLETRPRSCQI